MWEKDKKLLRAFRDCYTALQDSIKAGEEVDLASSCIDETEALINYTSQSIAHYKANTVQEVSEKKQRFYTPKVPYFQNF